jgi:hypothetical protein
VIEPATEARDEDDEERSRDLDVDMWGRSTPTGPPELAKQDGFGSFRDRDEWIWLGRICYLIRSG